MSSTATLASTDMTSSGMIPGDIPSARASNGASPAGMADQAAASPRDGANAAQGDHADPAGKDHLTFWDLLDVVNPLQHIPVVNTIYRELTGDTIKAPAKMAGALLYGGVIGLVAAVGDVVLEQETGEDFGTHILDTLGLHSHHTDVAADTGGKVGTVTASNVDGGTLLPDDISPPLPAAPVVKVEREVLPAPTAATAGRLPRVIPNLAAVAAVDVQTGKNGPVPAGNAADAASPAAGPDAARAAAPIGVARSFGHQYHPALANPGTAAPGALPPGATPGGGAMAGMPTGMSAGMIPGMGGGMGGGLGGGAGAGLPMMGAAAGAASAPSGAPVLSPAMLKGNPLAQGLAQQQQQRPAGAMTPVPDAPFVSHAATSLARYRGHPVMVAPGEGTLPVQAEYQQTANRLHNDAPVPAATTALAGSAVPAGAVSGPAPVSTPDPATPVATARGISAYRAAGRVAGQGTQMSSAYAASGMVPAVGTDTAGPAAVHAAAMPPPAAPSAAPPAPASPAPTTQAAARPAASSSAAPSATMPTASAAPPAALAQPPVDMRNFSEVMMANLAKYQQMQNQGPGAIH